MTDVSEYLTFSAGAPLITMIVALIRQVLPGIDGVHVPRVVFIATLFWGFILVASGHFTGDAAEYVIAVTITATAAIGLNRVDRLTKRNEGLTDDDIDV